MLCECVLQASIGLSAAAGSGIYTRGMPVATHYSFPTLVDDVMVLGSLPSPPSSPSSPSPPSPSSPSPASFHPLPSLPSASASHNTLSHDRPALEDSASVKQSEGGVLSLSPCGPQPYSDLPQSHCGEVNVAVGTGTYTVAATSGSLLCAATITLSCACR